MVIHNTTGHWGPVEVHDRKSQDYVYTKRGNYLRYENKVTLNKILYCKALRCETIKMM